MEITEYLNKENCIEIAIFNKVKKTYTDIKINNYYKNDKSKIEENNNKEKPENKGKDNSKINNDNKNIDIDNKNKMEIEENQENNNIIEESILPSIEIVSEDTDDSIFLNTLFNSIFV